MKNNNGKGGLAFWIVAGVMLLGGMWPVAVPMILFKLFGPDKKKSDYYQAPPLSRNYTYTPNRTSTSTYFYENGQRVYPSGQPAASNNTVNTRYGEYSASTVSQVARSMTQTPEASKLSTGLLFGFGFFLALIGLVGVTDTLSFFDFGEFMFSFSWLAGGVSMIAGGISLKRAAARYKKYLSIVGNTEAVEIAALAKKMGLKEKLVYKDLDKMCEKGYFGKGAYVNVELGYLFLNSEADEELSKYRAQAAEKQAAAKEQQAKEEIAEGYQKILRQIRDVNDRIAHEDMTRKIYVIEDVTRSIFTAVQNDPEKRGMIENFLSYYLPTTLKLLESYAKLEKSGLDGTNIDQSKKSIEDAMDSIVQGFKNQYDDLYKRDVLDIETEIDVMTNMLRQQQHTAADDFKIPAEEPKSAKKAAAPADSRSQFEKDFGLQHAGGTATAVYGGSAAAQQMEEK